MSWGGAASWWWLLSQVIVHRAQHYTVQEQMYEWQRHFYGTKNSQCSFKCCPDVNVCAKVHQNLCQDNSPQNSQRCWSCVSLSSPQQWEGCHHWEVLANTLPCLNTDFPCLRYIQYTPFARVSWLLSMATRSTGRFPSGLASWLGVRPVLISHMKFVTYRSTHPSAVCVEGKKDSKGGREKEKCCTCIASVSTTWLQTTPFFKKVINGGFRCNF